MAVGSYSHRVGGDGAVAKRLEGAAPLRGEQVAHRQPDEGEQRHAQPVEAAGAEAHPEKRRPRKAQTLRAPGQPLHLVQYGDVERGEAQRRERELRPFETQRRQGEERPESGGDGGRGERRDQEARSELGDEKARRVSADAEEGRLRQVDLAQVSDGDVEADEQDAVDGEEREESEQIVVLHRERQRQEHREHEQLGAADE